MFPVFIRYHAVNMILEYFRLVIQDVHYNDRMHAYINPVF